MACRRGSDRALGPGLSEPGTHAGDPSNACRILATKGRTHGLMAKAVLTESNGAVTIRRFPGVAFAALLLEEAAVTDSSPAISDRNLEATTNISLKREPACFAFLSAHSAAPPLSIDSINLDLASADYFQGRASLWTTLEMRSGVNGERPTALLGFDESFLRPFTRALVEAATTRASYRMTILSQNSDGGRCRVVEYVTGPGTALKELVIQPFESVMTIAATSCEGDESLFQLPRTDNFLRAFAKMSYTADQVLHDLLDEMDRVARRRTTAGS
jgi:hypothetical protein